MQHRIIMNAYPVQQLIRSIQTCPVSKSERPPLQHASQLALGTPSEHFSALSRCHTSKKSGRVGPKGPMPCRGTFVVSAWYTDL